MHIDLEDGCDELLQSDPGHEAPAMLVNSIVQPPNEDFGMTIVFGTSVTLSFLERFFFGRYFVQAGV